MNFPKRIFGESMHTLSYPKGRPTTAPEIVDYIIAMAIKSRASDIHLAVNQLGGPGGTSEPHSLRFRIFGKLQLIKCDFIGNLYKEVVSRLKVLAAMNITETVTPQDGQIKIHSTDGEAVLRISTVPSQESEDVVIRVQRSVQQNHNLSNLQMSSTLKHRLKTLIQQKSGMIVLNGPAGSGKTTTIYSILGTLASPERKIITAEDPVETRVPYVNHTQV